MLLERPLCIICVRRAGDIAAPGCLVGENEQCVKDVGALAPLLGIDPLIPRILPSPKRGAGAETWWERLSRSYLSRHG